LNDTPINPMSRTVAEKRAAFRKLHESGCFVLPNPWDVGSARMLQRLGFVALASTSTGYAWSTGRPDYGVSRADVLAHLTSLSGAVELPVNADFESGFASAPEGVAESVTLAVTTGVSGLSIEDRDVDARDALYETGYAVERIRAARHAIDRTGEDVILVARTELLFIDAQGVKQAIDKLVAFADAGADCLYAPGVRDAKHIEAMVRALAPKPLNVLAMGAALSVEALADLGVRRVSIGGALARVAWTAMISAATQLKAGSFDGLAGAMAGRELDAAFAGFGATPSA
jgi:2-methylisocitrate lyase-like PEP mutase family enzyme